MKLKFIYKIQIKKNSLKNIYSLVNSFLHIKDANEIYISVFFLIFHRQYHHLHIEIDQYNQTPCKIYY